MSKLSPYEALFEMQGITKKDLPSDIQTLVKRIEATKNTVLLNKKTDDNGNPIVSEQTLKKINDLDSQIVDKTWDFIEDKQRKEIRKSAPNPQIEKEVNVTSEVKSTPTTENKKEDSQGRVGFFSF